MKEFLLKLIAEDSNLSMTRFLSFVCVMTACLVVFYGIMVDAELNSLCGICSTFLGFGFGAKVIQKQLEK